MIDNQSNPKSSGVLHCHINPQSPDFCKTVEKIDVVVIPNDELTRLSHARNNNLLYILFAEINRRMYGK